MEKKNFMQVIKELKETKLSNRSSKEDAVQLATAYLNDSEHKFTEVKVVGGELEKTEVAPVKEFRNMVAGVMVKAGLDQADAEKFMNEYTFRKGEAAVLPALANEYIVGSISTGKKYSLAKREDLVVELQLVEKEEVVKTNKNPQNGEEIKTKYDPHYIVKAVSSAPTWKKTRVE